MADSPVRLTLQGAMPRLSGPTTGIRLPLRRWRKAGSAVRIHPMERPVSRSPVSAAPDPVTDSWRITGDSRLR
ncbi:hypothetical protein [Rhizohabitans arisaemae]|uniref:hypothetical protein n=1 Tax=Rhizohabitans arisaemae TaxID=2720610 RepID=UPI0024B152E3|nr:hypothetical protein [Rhizohabitans arisaemae]